MLLLFVSATLAQLQCAFRSEASAANQPLVIQARINGQVQTAAFNNPSANPTNCFKARFYCGLPNGIDPYCGNKGSTYGKYVELAGSITNCDVAKANLSAYRNLWQFDCCDQNNCNPLGLECYETVQGAVQKTRRSDTTLCSYGQVSCDTSDIAKQLCPPALVGTNQLFAFSEATNLSNEDYDSGRGNSFKWYKTCTISGCNQPRSSPDDFQGEFPEPTGPYPVPAGLLDYSCYQSSKGALIKAKRDPKGYCVYGELTCGNTNTARRICPPALVGTNKPFQFAEIGGPSFWDGYLLEDVTWVKGCIPDDCNFPRSKDGVPSTVTDVATGTTTVTATTVIATPVTTAKPRKTKTKTTKTKTKKPRKTKAPKSKKPKRTKAPKKPKTKKTKAPKPT